MADIKTIIRKVWTDLDSQVGPLVARQDELKSELRSIEQKLSTLLPQYNDAQKAAEAVGLDLVSSAPASFTPKHGEVTIKQAVRSILNVFVDGLTSADLLSRASESYFGGQLDRTSFSPQLSRMKRDGEVNSQSGIWTLTDKGRDILHSRPTLQFDKDPLFSGTGSVQSPASQAASTVFD